MNLLQQLQLATRSYLKHAYTDTAPERARELVHKLQEIENSDALLAWDGFEKEGNRYNLRLGNARYPHMKLVFILEDNSPVFYVDAHDSHFSLPPDMPGYDQLLKLREENKRLKAAIEASWASRQLPIFGHQTASIKYKKICADLRILASDDEVQILDMLGIIVTSLGAEFIRALSAEEAREIIADKGLPDLIFCDIMMPGESGYDFVHWLKGRYPDALVYFITGISQDDIDKIEIAEVLQKPFSAKAVMKIMKSIK